jgi:hypothetical protein
MRNPTRFSGLANRKARGILTIVATTGQRPSPSRQPGRERTAQHSFPSAEIIVGRAQTYSGDRRPEYSPAAYTDVVSGDAAQDAGEVLFSQVRSGACGVMKLRLWWIGACEWCGTASQPNPR